MAFEDDRDNIKEKLENMGATVIIDNEKHRLTVNNKYVYCYTNSYYSTLDGEPLSRGIQSFIKMIENDK